MNEPTNQKYERRSQWDATQQEREVRALLKHHGVNPELSDTIDWIYRPCLEKQEHRLNQVSQALRELMEAVRAREAGFAPVEAVDARIRHAETVLT